jgi:hypothetical protein
MSGCQNLGRETVELLCQWLASIDHQENFESNARLAGGQTG